MRTPYPLTPTLDHPAYHTPVKLRGYGPNITVFRTCLPRDGGRVLKVANPDWSQAEHAELALKHGAEGARLDLVYKELLDLTHLETFGKPRRFEDYRISAIGRDDYPEARKQQLRAAAHGATYHKHLSSAHAAAGRCRRSPASL